MDERLQMLARLRDDLQFFGREVLKIRTKTGDLIPFVMNDAQLAAHALIAEQRERKGWVRAMILKGRQQGISTYIAARFYHKTAMRRGINTYILTHEQPATDTLFGMVDRFQRNAGNIAPHVGASNAKELEFDRLMSSYAVATAGTKAGGRSKTISLLHGSEVAFWANAADHFAASVQGVPGLPGTEIVLESTSAGASGEFYERWQMAEAGEGDFIPIFLPWWLSKEYARDPEFGFVLDNSADEGSMSEQEYADTWKLSSRQMAWRRAKILELRSSTLFQREYPADPAEAWTAPTGHESFITPLTVMRARKRRTEGVGPLIIGVDPASNGGDRFSIAWRRGMRVERVEYRNKINHLEGTQWIRDVIDRDKPVRVNIDSGNIGSSIVTGLKTIGAQYANIVRGVDFGGVSQWRLAKPKVPGPWNRRAEMWMRVRDWLLLPEGASLPDDSALQSDLVGPRNKPRLDNWFLLESKDEMKKRQVRSPDLGDSVALTFAFSETFADWTEAQTPVTFGNVDRVPQAGPPINYETSSTSWMG